jgi:hypothetical protein
MRASSVQAASSTALIRYSRVMRGKDGMFFECLRPSHEAR